LIKASAVFFVIRAADGGEKLGEHSGRHSPGARPPTPQSGAKVIDGSAFDQLIEESQDIHSDAMRDATASLPDLTDLAADRRGEEVDPGEIEAYNQGRSELVSDLGKAGLLAGGIGALLAGILATPASASTEVDIQALQTNSSIEILAIATYGAALTLPFIKDGNPVVVEFAKTTRMQHDEHRKAFQAQTKALGGKKQKTPNPKYAPVVEAAKPGLTTPLAVVELAATLEEVATETYLNEQSFLSNRKSRRIVASVMAVETQHLGTLRAVRALLEGGAIDLLTIPPDLAALPAAAGNAAFPTAVQDTDKASPPEEGAI